LEKAWFPAYLTHEVATNIDKTGSNKYDTSKNSSTVYAMTKSNTNRNSSPMYTLTKYETSRNSSSVYAFVGACIYSGGMESCDWSTRYIHISNMYFNEKYVQNVEVDANVGHNENIVVTTGCLKKRGIKEFNMKDM
jgi:hypothetical protein